MTACWTREAFWTRECLLLGRPMEACWTRGAIVNACSLKKPAGPRMLDPQGDWFHTKSFWCLIGVAVRDGEPILCEVRATPLGVLFADL